MGNKRHRRDFGWQWLAAHQQRNLRAEPGEIGPYLRDLVLDGRLVILPTLEHAEELVYQLGMLEAKELPRGGIASKKSRIRGHGHLDIAAALEAAVWADRQLHGAIAKREPGEAASTGTTVVRSAFGTGRGGGLIPHGTTGDPEDSWVE